MSITSRLDKKMTNNERHVHACRASRYLYPVFASPYLLFRAWAITLFLRLQNPAGTSPFAKTVCN